ncbi:MULTISPECIES: hypothetical protein [unclassified Bradyrhizobium]|uniref:hypothetical protein n=1 Tax=Bradyrhizobium sp. IC4060 TaxID=2793807 RepID=UPI001CD4E67B|nr:MULTISPECIES: hypothetical protein [unclassified Bradyrhizobium]MCA1378604.1 hypothetical protein [Bradyrhizobium sp. IC4060]MCA1488427.1 hypothetical protein [Bradyrhizobium sp. IC4061]
MAVLVGLRFWQRGPNLLCHLQEMRQCKTAYATQIFLLICLDQIFVSSDMICFPAASTHEALGERVLRAIIINRYFAGLTINLRDGIQNNGFGFDSDIGARATIMINKVDKITTKVPITVDLYGSLVGRPLNSATKSPHDSAARYCFPRKQTKSVDLGRANEKPITLLIAVVILRHIESFPVP